ncbi:GntR family transcriptional regulator [Hasllibacter halocynthiae]|uniref:GntR family transcriptional regulator n=1 Tax=Hasllibacter halocynthiae TaxID=595589 RepID=A0A2T0X2C9_9RHOB|nr:GntR family transcriptional regulator [Hasllibacter halocynthiae]PRY93098.1 GntR family transcriptional regulator [Hasllibacter halocynthiae]
MDEDDGTHVARGGTGARIAATLTEDIAAGLLAPGERLDETRVAERFGTSRTPVREALASLAAQGILVSEPRRGVRVASYTREQLAHMFETMQELEAVCAKLAAQRLTLLSRGALEAAQAECRAAAEAGDVSRYLPANEAFHQAIYAATQNPYMADLASDFRRRTGPFRARRFVTKDDLLASTAGHDALLSVIRGGDAERAEGDMRAHMAESYIRALSLS